MDKTLKINSLAADNEEMLPICDREGKIIGKALRSICHKDKTLIHPVVHVHIINKAGEVFLQKRSKKKTDSARQMGHFRWRTHNFRRRNLRGSQTRGLGRSRYYRR